MTNIAVIVGSNYIGTSNELGGCGNDARDYAEIYRGLGFKTTVLTDVTGLVYSTGENVEVAGLPTYDNIMTNVAQAMRNAKPGDKVVFCYSGHGTQIPAGFGKSKEDFIVPLDVVTDPSGFAQDKLISSKQIHSMLTLIPVGAKAEMISDSCFSGKIAELHYNVRGLNHEEKQQWMMHLLTLAPMQHLTALINASSDSKMHGDITLVAGCTAVEESTDLGKNGALTFAIKSWIAENTSAKWLEVSWDYTSHALSQLKKYLTDVVKAQGVTTQDPQISYDPATARALVAQHDESFLEQLSSCCFRIPSMLFSSASSRASASTSPSSSPSSIVGSPSSSNSESDTETKRVQMG